MRSIGFAVLVATSISCAPPSMPEQQPPVVMQPPTTTPGPLKATVSGRVQVFASSQSVDEHPKSQSPIAASLSTVRRSAKPPRPSTTLAGAVQKGTTAPTSNEAEEVIPGELIIGTVEPIDAKALLELLTPEKHGLRCVQKGWASERMQLIACTWLDGSALTVTQTRAFTDTFGLPQGIRFISVNVVQRAFAMPNDPRYVEQWHYRAMNLPSAWDITTGTSTVVVAVIDTGIGSNADLDANVLPGIDLITDPENAGDGNGRDDDPTDRFGPVDPRNGGSHWHGTHCAGTIAATTNNGVGVAGVAPGVRILPVRVLGGGTNSTFDVAAGIVWSVGAVVPGTRTNSTPASVVSMSLGGAASVQPAYVDALDVATARRAVVVVAAGNENASAVGFAPCNTPGIICVAATDYRGNVTTYSNYGAAVSIAAPGGETANDDDGNGLPDGVLSTIGNNGYASMQGTSMATPHVAGLVALMKSLDPTLTHARVKAVLEQASSPIENCPPGCGGAGLVDATRALLLVRPDPNARPGVLTTSASAIVVTAEATSQTVRLSNTGGVSITVTLQTDTAHVPSLSWQTPGTPLVIGPSESAQVTVTWKSAITHDEDVEAQFSTGASTVPLIIRLRAPRAAPKTMVSLMFREAHEAWQYADTVWAAADGAFTLAPPPGRYWLAAWSDDDGDGEFEDGEGFGLWPSMTEPKEITIEAGQTVTNARFAVAPVALERSRTGDACSSVSECDADQQCTSWSGGYCTRACTSSSECGEGNFCVTSNGESACLRGCAAPGTQSDCRSGYSCRALQSGKGACLPE